MVSSILIWMAVKADQAVANVQVIGLPHALSTVRPDDVANFYNHQRMREEGGRSRHGFCSSARRAMFAEQEG